MKMLNRILLAATRTTSTITLSRFSSCSYSSMRASSRTFRVIVALQQQQQQPSRRLTTTTMHRRMMSSSSSSSSPSYTLPSWTQVQDVVGLTKSSSSSTSSSLPIIMDGPRQELALMSLLQADAVCFDVDSTVITEEGIDVLADYLGKGEEVKALTKRAMEGNNLKFEEALQMRLDLLQPTRQQIQRLLQERPLQLTPGVEEFIQVLASHGVDVYLVSGGFRLMIEPIAKQLCIARDRIVANTLLFDDKTGAYQGFDPTEPTSADLGKRKALQQIKEENEYQVMIMIGDGATDAQAKPPADAFIGFGGVVVREPVKQVADLFVTSFEPLTTLVKQFGKNKLNDKQDEKENEVEKK